jgi:hypothetical protein
MGDSIVFARRRDDEYADCAVDDDNVTEATIGGSTRFERMCGDEYAD